MKDIDPPVITFLHGYPTSSFDFAPLLECLTKETHPAAAATNGAPAAAAAAGAKSGSSDGGAVAAAAGAGTSRLAQLGMRLLFIDLLGYGNSDKGIGQARFSVQQQANLVVAVWERYGVSRTHLVVHDFSVSVCQELLGREPKDHLGGVELGKVLWLNGSVFVDLYRPLGVERMLARKGAGWAAAALMGRTTLDATITQKFSPKHPCDKKMLDQMYIGVQQHGGLKILHKLVRYMKDRRRYKYVWQGALELALRRDPRRMLFLWGMQDPVSGAHIATELHARFDKYGPGLIQEQPDLGHWPHLEAPDRVADAIVAHFGSEPWKAYLPSPKPFEMDLHIQIRKVGSRRSIDMRRTSVEVYRRGSSSLHGGAPSASGGVNGSGAGGTSFGRTSDTLRAKLSGGLEGEGSGGGGAMSPGNIGIPHTPSLPKVGEAHNEGEDHHHHSSSTSTTSTTAAATAASPAGPADSDKAAAAAADRGAAAAAAAAAGGDAVAGGGVMRDASRAASEGSVLNGSTSLPGQAAD